MEKENLYYIFGENVNGKSYVFYSLPWNEYTSLHTHATFVIRDQVETLFLN